MYRCETIFLFEKDDIVRHSIRSNLQSCGYDVYSTGSRRNALYLIGREIFNGVISDVDGIEDFDVSLELERKLIHLGNLPPVLFVSEDRLFERDRIYLGPSSFLAKPFSGEKLLEKVEQMFRRK